MKEKDKIVLDASALLAYLKGEKGKEKVRSILKKAQANEIETFMHIINLMEIYYAIYRHEGKYKAYETFLKIKRLPINFFPLVLDDVPKVGEVKALKKTSLGDCFLFYLSQKENAKILTGDKEFKKYQTELEIEWI